MSLRCLLGFHDPEYLSWLQTGQRWVRCKRCNRAVRNPN